MSGSVVQAQDLLNDSDYAGLFAGLPTAYLVLTPDLTIAAANGAYLQLLQRTREQLVGQHVFDAFPPTPEALDAQGRNPLQLSFERVRDSGRPDAMPLYSYAVYDPASGLPVQRYWSLIHAPILHEDGSTRLLLQRVEDVTDYVQEREGRRVAVERGEELQRRAEAVEADLYVRATELAVALKAKDALARKLASLGEVALELAAAETLEDLERIIVGRGLSVLGAGGGAIISPDGTGNWRATLPSLGSHVEVIYGQVPYDSPLPAPWVARTGEQKLLPTREAGLAFHPIMAEVYTDTLCRGWAFLPLTVRGEILGSLAVAWTDEHECDVDELNLLNGFAAQCAQSLDRIRATTAQREAVLSAQRMSYTLQRSMLVNPSLPAMLDVAVRYQPASQEAQVGGDWYDAFTTATGATTLVIGDVHGHDQDAAAAMGQIRNLLRGMAYHGQDGPAELLRKLDTALGGLEVAALATGLVASISDDVSASGSVHMRWSNAGHLPPVLREPDGSVRILDTVPDLTLGIDALSARTQHDIELAPGSTLLLYTDGLVERRNSSLDTGIAELARTLADEGDSDPGQVCSRLLESIDTFTNEDDIAILVLRVRRVG